MTQFPRAAGGCDSWNQQIRDIGATGACAIARRDRQFGVLGDYRLGRYFSIGGGYANLGTVRLTADARRGAVTFSREGFFGTVQTLLFRGTGIVALTPRLSLEGSGGFQRWRARSGGVTKTFAEGMLVDTDANEQSDAGWNPYISAGVRFRLNRWLGLWFGFSRFMLNNGPVDERANVFSGGPVINVGNGAPPRGPVVAGGPTTTPDPGASNSDREPPRRLGILLTRDDDNWVPEYRNNAAMTAAIYEKNALSQWVPSNERRVITIGFVERSHEPGMCLNANLPSDPQNGPDLFFDAAVNSSFVCRDAENGNDFGRCDTRAPVSSQTITVTSVDYGSYSRLEASCPDCVRLRMVNRVVSEAPAGQHVVALPKDDDGNQIADFLPQFSNIRADQDEDASPAGATTGDGLSAYEEYRGFKVIDVVSPHKRLTPRTKELFVRNPDNLVLTVFQGASGLTVYQIDSSQWDGDDSRVVNFNHGHANVAAQHGLKLLVEPIDITLGNGQPAAGYSYGFGPPKNVGKIAIRPGEQGDARLVTHELGHGVGMRHHGDIDTEKRAIVAQNSPTSAVIGDIIKAALDPSLGNLGSLALDVLKSALPDSSIHAGAGATSVCNGTVAVPGTIDVGHAGDQQSGDASCYMRYRNYSSVVLGGGGAILCPNVPPVGATAFCTSPAGTGPNAGGAGSGNATVGNCKGQINVSDK